MRPGSVIFLIVSVLVIIAGLVLCTVGVNVAQEQNVALFSTDVSVIDGDVIRSDVLTDTEINKVKMTLDNVNIHILKSETGEAYLELRNFQVGTYDYSVQNKMLLVDNETSIFSLMRIAEGNFNFDGLRHYLTYKTSENTQKELYLYLTENASVNSFDITCTRGNITVEDLSLATDYNISLRAGDITLRSVSTKSTLNIATDHGIITLDDVGCRQGHVTIGRGAGDFLLRGVPAEFIATVEDGDFEVGYLAQNEYGLLFSLDASGTVTFNGEEKTERPFTFSNSPGPGPQTYTAVNGNVSCTVAATAISGRFTALSEALAAEAATMNFEDEGDTTDTEDTDSASVTDTVTASTENAA